MNCFCQHENGGAERRGILCALAEEETGIVIGEYQKVADCGLTEWCTGPSSPNNSVRGATGFGKHHLCTQGN